MERKYSHQREVSTKGDIRLFDLLPGEESAEIQIRFLYASLSDEASLPHYYALSYTWGVSPSSKTLKVDVNGELYEMSITANLESALRQLRSPRSTRKLWVDALCINQVGLNVEKPVQIGQMDQIYGQARSVVVWLGPESDNSNLAMQFIPSIVNLSSIDGIVQDPLYKEHWKALGALIRRDWFSRRWVVQELALAKSAVVYCGHKRIEWEIFAQAVSIFETRAQDVQVLFGNDQYEFGELQGLGAQNLITTTSTTNGVKSATLESLLCNLSAFKTSNPWDTLFAFTSLAVDGRIVKVDYKKNLSDVFSSVVWDTIDATNSVDMILRAWAPTLDEIEDWRSAEKSRGQTQSQQVLPSWIRDTSYAEFGPRSNKSGVPYERYNATPFVGMPGQPTYNASGSSRFTTMSNQRDPRADGRSLILRGFCLDVIATTGGYATRGNVPPNWPKLAGWEVRDASNVPDAFWRTLVADRGVNGARPPVWYRKACEHAWADSPRGTLDTFLVLQHNESSMTRAFISKVRRTIWEREMFVTSDYKLLGLGPSDISHAKPLVDGDAIFIIKGCSVPVILRSVRKGKYQLGMYELVGECYVHGMMDGDAAALAGFENKSVPWEKLEVI